MERTVVVCDVCGEPATDTVAIRVKGRSLQKDLCATHLAELIQGARAARRGRPRTAGTAASDGTAKKSTGRRGRPRKTATAATANGTAAPRRRGRPRKVATTA
jgi:hypothetical protein